jgi:hypothetical protein
MTSLTDLRNFLDRHTGAPAPWTPPRAVVDALLALLVERRGDDAFWTDLRGLAARLRDRQVSPALLRGAEVLDGQTITGLLDALRASLPPEPRPALHWARTAAAPALAAFLVLGMAVGCSGKDDSVGGADAEGDADTDTDADSDTDTDVDCAEAKAAGVSGASADVFCDLVDLVRGSELSEHYQDMLLACLDEFSAKERGAMLKSFSTMTDEELEKALLELVKDDRCWSGGGSH